MDENEEAWEVIRKSLRGSDEIDRMKGEIDQFVKMVIGLYEPCCHNWKELHRGVEFPTAKKDYSWEMKIVKKKLRVSYLCHPFPKYPESSSVEYSSSGIELLHNRVAQAYSALSAFYAGMERFALKDRLRPFLDAAEAAEKK